MSVPIDSRKMTPIRVLMLGAGLDVQGGITSVEQLILEHALPEVNIRHVATFAKGTASHNIKVFLRSIAVLIQSSFSHTVDVVHIHFSDRGSTLRKVILACLVLGIRKPLILHAHGAAYKDFFTGLPRVAQWLIAGVFSRCTKFIALSESWRSYYTALFRLKPDQLIVLQNPVVLPPEVPDRTERKLVTFVFLGRIGKRGGAMDMVRSLMPVSQQDKGAFDLIRAFAELPESDKVSAQLILAGNGDIEMAQQMIEELGLSGRAFIRSWLDATQRDELLANADAFVLPSYNEGLPMSMLEAMAWSLPVIVTPVGGIPEVINQNENGLLIQPGNLAELVWAMQRLIRDESYRISLGISARNSIQSLDIKKYVCSLYEVYASSVV